MDGELVFEWPASVAPWPDDDQEWHPQFGAYGWPAHNEIYFDDLIIATKDAP
jgi:hypothetical protein